jgi:hypothetical protein
MSSNHSSPAVAPPSRVPELIARRHASLSAEYTHLAAHSRDVCDETKLGAKAVGWALRIQR